MASAAATFPERMTDDHGNELDPPPRRPGQDDHGNELEPELERRVSGLERRISRAELDEDTRRAVAVLPDAVLGLQGDLRRVDERSASLSEAHGQVRRELENVRGAVTDGLRDIRREVAADVVRLEAAVVDLRTLAVARFDTVDTAHAEAAAERWVNRPYADRLKDVMVIATPIILGLLTLAGVIYAARVGAPSK